MMTRDEFLKKSGDIGKVKSHEEFGEAETNKPKTNPFSIYKPKGNGDDDKPKPPTSPAGGAAALPVPPLKKAAMKKEGFKSFNEWFSTRNPSN